MEKKLPDQSQPQTNPTAQTPPSPPATDTKQPMSSPEKKASASVMMIVLGVLVLVAVGAAAFFMLKPTAPQKLPLQKADQQTKMEDKNPAEETEQATEGQLENMIEDETAEEMQEGPTAIPTATLSPQQEATKDWQTYTDPDCGFTIKYPSNANVQDIPASTPKYCSIDLPDCIVEEQLCATHISYVGPDQPEGPTSLGDGYGITITVSKKPADKTVKQMADLYIKRCDPALSTVAPASIAGINGFSYQCGGLGTFTEFWGPYKNDSLKILSFNHSVTQNKAAEYQKIVDLILGTYQN